MTNFNQHNTTILHWMECSNVTGEHDDDESIDVKIPESEGMHVVEGFGISSEQFCNPLKVNKINVGSLENPKFSNIGDYWDYETIEKITDLLHEFQDLFATKFLEMKGIIEDLG